MKYNEKKEKTKAHKSDYAQGIENIIKTRQKNAEKIRSEYAKEIFINQEKYRDDLKKMLGWPLVDFHIDKAPKVKTKLLSTEDGYKIYRMQFEVFEGLNMTGLFFKQDGEDEKPMVIVQHGRLGTPELISGIYGDTGIYNNILQRVAKNNAHVFAPQLLLWHDEYDVKFDRKEIDGRLKRVGSSITAIEVFGIGRILDYFESEKYVSLFGMVGFSYGGFFTLYTAAIDKRIKSAISCSYFNTRDAIGWQDWVWFKSAEKFDDAEVACLIYPRKLSIEIGDNDEFFDCKYGIESFEKLKKLCQSVGTEWVDLKVLGGIHEFCKDDEPIQKLVSDIRAK